MEKKANIVLLLANPNDETTNSIFLKDRNWYHLYVTTDEKIKKDDWYIADNKVYGASVDHMPELYTYPCKKIIATTDKSLKIKNPTFQGYNLPDSIFPQLSQSFIEHFVSEYNKGNIITEVMVEYEPKRWINNPKLTKEQDEQDFDLIKSTEDYDKYLNYGLKINPDNTINIKPIKDNYVEKT